MDDVVALSAQLANLRELRANGASKVEANDHSVTFRSDTELAAAIADLERRIAGAGRPRVRTVLIHTSKGL